MTEQTQTLVERVAQVICADSYPDCPKAWHDEARAAITAVFDWLAEPSKEAVTEGRYAICAEPDTHADSNEAAQACYLAMLAQMRKEALGE
jgi:hypothetical protein